MCPQREYLENCRYYEIGDCPQPEAIDRVFLIPQLLDPSEIEAAKQICQDCGKYLDQKRKYPRIRRPLQIIINSLGHVPIFWKNTKPKMRSDH